MKKDILPVDVVLSVGGNVIVYNQRHLLDINTSGLRRMETQPLITRLLDAFSFWIHHGLIPFYVFCTLKEHGNDMASNKTTDPQSGEKKEKAYPSRFENSLIKYHLQISCDSRTCSRATVECRWVFLPRNFQSFANTADRRRGNLGKAGHKKAMEPTTQDAL